ncbi:class Ib ribonucleoside-diphosphate reductase assembly flavoprotein NrdI [Kocuria rhizophila]|nr:class Ib ribonucleoside-diphosphate reductase assembly flavoprotein NrdI [Kocuria rhizophila]
MADEDAPLVVYFSSVTRNTATGSSPSLPARSVRLPLKTSEPAPASRSRTCWQCPAYDAPGSGSVPRSLSSNDAPSRQHLTGAPAWATPTFGPLFCVAAEKVAAKRQVPRPTSSS